VARRSPATVANDPFVVYNSSMSWVPKAAATTCLISPSTYKTLPAGGPTTLIPRNLSHLASATAMRQATRSNAQAEPRRDTDRNSHHDPRFYNSADMV